MAEPTTLVLLTGPWKIKRGVTSPPYRVILRQANKQPLDLSGCTLTFVMRLRGAADPTVEAEANVLQEGDADTGINVGMAEYPWAVGDTDTSGVYDVEFFGRDSGGNTFRVPNDDYLEIQILGNLSGEPPASP
jgi:hypothetical protein